MTEEIFVVVVLLLMLKYTIDLAGSTRPGRRRKPVPLADRAAAVRRSWTRLPRHWGKVISLGALVAIVGWVSDKAAAPFVLAAGVAVLQTGVFLAGVRWARRPRRRAPRPAPEERTSDRAAIGVAVATRTA